MPNPSPPTRGGIEHVSISVSRAGTCRDEKGFSIKKIQDESWGWAHSTQVAFTLHTQRPWVQIPVSTRTHLSNSVYVRDFANAFSGEGLLLLQKIYNTWTQTVVSTFSISWGSKRITNGQPNCFTSRWMFSSSKLLTRVDVSGIKIDADPAKIYASPKIVSLCHQHRCQWRL